MMWGYFGSWAMWPWMVVGWLFWIGIVVLAVWAATSWLHRRSEQTTDSAVTGPAALTILQRRFAAGEIDRDTYDRMYRVLEDDRHGAPQP